MQAAPPSESYIGPYRIVDVIGRGGSGVIYRAAEPGGGRTVAVKTLRQVQELELESLRREAHLLAQLKHPGIVGVIDSGVDGGLPWYSMELIEGKTLSAVLSEGPALERIAALTARLCEPLAFLHGEGIVHRDLKPENIVVREGDHPVIVDFGLISYFVGASGREALEAGGELLGTVAYMSPEQVRADFVDARSDLYSLGCILYEAVTGHPPFRGNVPTVLDKHLHATPKRPAEIVPNIDPALDALIVQLLAKKPRERPGYAEDVARVLWQLSGESQIATQRPARSYLYRPSFVAREAPTGEVVRALDRAETGSGSLIVASGESGVGKTRFAMEAARLAKKRGFEVVTTQCLVDSGAGPTGAPLGPLRPLLRAIADRCIAEGRATADRVLGRRSKVLAAYEPTLMQVPGFSDQPELPVLPPDADRERTLADIVETVSLHVDERSPLLFVVDDVQWADDLTLSLLSVLRDGLVPRQRIVILALYRTEDTRPAIQRLVAAPGVVDLALQRLDAEAVGRIVADMLAIEEPPFPLVHLLTRESEGNPFFVGEYLRGSVEAEFLRRSPLGEWYLEATDHVSDPLRGGLPMSSSLRGVISRRLRDLDDPTRGFIEAGAVLGRAFSSELAGELAGISEEQRMQVVIRLHQRQILETAEAGQVRFIHDKLREVTYDGTAGSRKVALHRRAAEALEATSKASGDKQWASLAHHWLVAGDKSKAIDYFGLAGARALEVGAYGDAHLHLASALRLDDERGGLAGQLRRSHWRRMLATASYGIGDLEASIRHATDALVGLGEKVPSSQRGWVATTVAELLRRMLRPGLVTRLRGAEHPRTEISSEAALASAQLATSYFYRTETVPTLANLLRSLNRAERAGNASLIVEASSRVAYVAAASGLHRIAHRYFERAEYAGHDGTTPREIGVSRYLCAQYAIGQGRWVQGQALARDSIHLLDEIGDRQEAETARAIAAHGYYYAGDFGSADSLLREVLRSARDRAHEQHMAWARFLLGRTQLALGRGAEAIPFLVQARAPLLRLRDVLSLCMCEGLLSLALWRVREHSRAEEVATCLVGRMAEGARAGVPHALDGYGGVLECLFELSLSGESPSHVADSQRVHRYLRSHARMFPLALPQTHRSRGWTFWMQGRRSRALRCWRDGVHAAERLGMRLEEACCHEQLARFSLDEFEARDSSRIATEIRADLLRTMEVFGS